MAFRPVLTLSDLIEVFNSFSAAYAKAVPGSKRNDAVAVFLYLTQTDKRFLSVAKKAREWALSEDYAFRKEFELFRNDIPAGNTYFDNHKKQMTHVPGAIAVNEHTISWLCDLYQSSNDPRRTATTSTRYAPQILQMLEDKKNEKSKQVQMVLSRARAASVAVAGVSARTRNNFDRMSGVAVAGAKLTPAQIRMVAKKAGLEVYQADRTTYGVRDAQGRGREIGSEKEAKQFLVELIQKAAETTPSLLGPAKPKKAKATAAAAKKEPARFDNNATYSYYYRTVRLGFSEDKPWFRVDLWLCKHMDVDYSLGKKFENKHKELREESKREGGFGNGISFGYQGRDIKLTSIKGSFRHSHTGTNGKGPLFVLHDAKELKGARLRAVLSSTKESAAKEATASAPAKLVDTIPALRVQIHNGIRKRGIDDNWEYNVHESKGHVTIIFTDADSSDSATVAIEEVVDRGVGFKRTMSRNRKIIVSDRVRTKSDGPKGLIEAASFSVDALLDSIAPAK